VGDACAARMIDLLSRRPVLACGVGGGRPEAWAPILGSPVVARGGTSAIGLRAALVWVAVWDELGVLGGASSGGLPVSRAVRQRGRCKGDVGPPPAPLVHLLLERGAVAGSGVCLMCDSKWITVLWRQSPCGRLPRGARACVRCCQMSCGERVRSAAWCTCPPYGFTHNYTRSSGSRCRSGAWHLDTAAPRGPAPEARRR